MAKETVKAVTETSKEAKTDKEVSIPKGLNKKLVEIQREIGIIIKSSENPYFKSKYADINDIIDVVKPVLNKYGVVLLQPLTTLGASPALLPSSSCV